MSRSITAILLCFVTLSAFGQSKLKYQVGTVVAVNPHTTKPDSASESTSYDVSVRVNNTVYVVLATVPAGTETVKYMTGRDVLVAVGEKTLTYNNILGQSFEVPILRTMPAQAKPE